MAVLKSKSLTIRLTPEAKEYLQDTARASGLSAAAFIEMLVRQHCKREGKTLGKPRNETK